MGAYIKLYISLKTGCLLQMQCYGYYTVLFDMTKCCELFLWHEGREVVFKEMLDVLYFID